MDQFVRIDNKIVQVLVKCSAVFIEQSLEFIRSMINNGKLSQEKGKRYIKEILHSIFFIGYINKPAINPENVLREDLHSKLSQSCPDVFNLYKSQVLRRPPFSVLLELVVETSVDRNDSDSVLRELGKLIDKMVVDRSEGSNENSFCLGATVVSYSYFKRSNLKTLKYFGASMACKGRVATRIFIHSACIETWDDSVAHAVCLAERNYTSVKLPETVYSTAVHMNMNMNSHEYDLKSPCELCLKIFPNVSFSPRIDEQKAEWNYGNCAECEAISNLLKGEPSVREETQWLNARLEPSLEELRKKRKEQLRGHLQFCKVTKRSDPIIFYNPE